MIFTHRFHQPGETAESAIEREVYEEVEVKLKISNITISHGLFPASLCRYRGNADGVIKPDGIEIDKADWFHYDNLPQVPTGNISISGQLIESYLEKHKS